MSKIDRGFSSSVEDRVDRVHDTKSKRPLNGAFLSRVLTGDGDSERVLVESLVGEKVTPFAYPFASRSAWIRGQPEATTTMISIIGSDTNDIQAVGYFDPAKSNAAAQYRLTAGEARQQPTESVDTQILPYRSLLPGEVDMGALYAQTFLGKGDVHQSRGGLTHWTMTSKAARLETPLFEVQGAAHRLVSSGDLIDEVRYGTVRRALTEQLTDDAPKSTPTQQSLIPVEGVVNTRNPAAAPPLPTFAKEFSVVLNWYGDPDRLIDHRQGIVVEDNGKLAESRQTQKRLRARMRWFTTGGGETAAEIDEKGNTVFLTSEKATEGIVVSVPAGDLKIKVGGQDAQGGGGGVFQLQVTSDVKMSAEGNFKISAEKDFQVKAGGRGQIELKRGILMKSDGVINIDAKPMSGIALGDKQADKYPVLVAQPDYIETLNNTWSELTSLAGTLATYGGSAATAWAAVGPLLMILDSSGSVMGLCQSAGSAAGQIASAAPSVSSAIGKHLPRLAQMPSGFMSSKTVSE